MEQPIRYISYIINYCLVLVTESNLRYRDVYLYISMSLRITQRAKLFFLECYIFIFCLFSGSENYFKEVTDALSNYTHPKSRFVFTSSGGVFTGRNYILHIILLSSLNNSPAVIINNYFYFLTKSFMLKYRYLISHICTYIQMHQHSYVGYIIIYYICGIMYKIQ